MISRTSTRLRRLGLLAAVVAASLTLMAEGASAVAAAPVISAPVLAAFHGGEVTIAGAGFGTAGPNSRVTFDNSESSTDIASTSLFVASWTDRSIVVTPPPSVRTGTVRVIAGGASSAPSDLLVFDFSFRGVPPSAGHHPLPLDIAVGPDGRVWTDEEFHLELKAYPPDQLAPITAVMPPQAAGDGIFAQSTIGNSPAQFSVLGEDVDVDASGRIWLTQGGGYLYDGPYPNASRIIRYDPASQAIACFTAPVDRSEVIGLVVDEQRGLVWFAESGLVTGNAITAFRPDQMPSNCLLDPAVSPPPPVCPGDVAPGCYRRYPLPAPKRGPAQLELDAAGDVWFTQSWSTSIARLSPASGAIVQYPLPHAETTVGPGAQIGSFPWQLAFDDEGGLWINEQFDAEIYRFRPSLAAQFNCTTLNASGDNPCAEEIFDGSNNVDGKFLHSLTIAADGHVWFTLSGDGEARLGFIAPEHGNAAVLLPPLSTTGTLSGVDEDAARGTIWFGMFDNRRIGRLDPSLAGGPDRDGDGCADGEESGASPLFGGMRNPTSQWDFYDVNATRTIDSLDVNLVRSHFSASGTKPGDAAYDRSRGAYPWAPGPPDGRINAIDLALVRVAFNHSCVALP